jgi:hypothetical protein
MKRSFGNYRRLARGLLSCSSLWLSEANLLYVCGAGVLVPFAEQYHRFDLRRIHSIALVRTHTGWVLNIIFGTIALAFGGLGLFAIINAADVVGPESVLFYLTGVPSAALGSVAFVFLVGNLALGPTCHLQVQTATRIQRIRSVRRLRVGQEVLAVVTPILAQAQAAGAPAGSPAAAGGAVSEPLAVGLAAG